MSKPKPKGPSAASIIRDKQNRRLGWTYALAELIDNSVGNGASCVSVELSRSEVKVIDNGNGCNPEMFAALVSLGWHEEDSDTENTVSRYGVGAKDAMLWFGGPTIAASARDGLYQFTEVDWESFREEFDYDEPIDGDAAKKSCFELGLNGSGVVVYAPSHRRSITEHNFGEVHKSLSRLFWAAVETGVDISVTFTPNRKRPRKNLSGGLLNGKPMPKLMEDASIDCRASLEDGRTVRIVGGVLDPLVRLSSPGFEYIYGHRVVIEAGGTGAGKYDFERLYVRVFLEGSKEDWEVTSNKTGLHDADEAALAQAVYDCCEYLLQRASSEAMSRLEDDALMKELSESLTEASRKHAKRKSPENNTGTKATTGEGSEHAKASNVHERRGKYERKSGGQRDGIDLFCSEFDEESEHLFGKAIVRDRIVRLNKLHPSVLQAIDNRDKTALHMMAWALWSDAWTWTESSGQRRIVNAGDFVEKMSAMLKVGTQKS